MIEMEKTNTLYVLARIRNSTEHKRLQMTVIRNSDGLTS